MVCATLVGDIISNISVKLFEFGSVVIEMSMEDISIFSSDSHNHKQNQQSGMISATLVQGIIRYTNL